MKVAINVCFGGFSLSPEATLEIYRRGGPIEATPVDEYWKPGSHAAESEFIGKAAALKRWHEYKAQQPGSKRDSIFVTVFNEDETLVLYARDIPRDDPILIAVVEEMGQLADGGLARLRIVEIPDGTNFEIDEYDGNEHIAEKHRTWS